MLEQPPTPEKLHQVSSFAEAEELLTIKLPETKRQLFIGEKGIDRAAHFFDSLGSPQDQFRSIHVAGTSGKGSTCYYIEALLRAHGFKTGLHVSPHVVDIRERMAVDGRLISKPNFVDTLNELIPSINGMRHTKWLRPTYFETTNAMAFRVFADEAVDYAVIETGLGGLYDSTNTISREDKFSVITRLGLDHTEVLGDTPEAIAFQKAGILTENGRGLILRPDTSPAQAAIEKTALDRSTTIDIVDKPDLSAKLSLDGIAFSHDNRLIHLPTVARFQKENAILAIETVKQLAERDGFIFDYDAAIEALAGAMVPGRAEVRELDGCVVIFDGAHNPQKMETFISSLRAASPDIKPHWVVGIKDGKDARQIIEPIADYVQSITFTDFFSQQASKHLQSFAYNPKQLQAIWQDISPVSAEATDDISIALRNALTSTTEAPVVVSGSLYMVGEILSQLQQ